MCVQMSLGRGGGAVGAIMADVSPWGFMVEGVFGTIWPIAGANVKLGHHSSLKTSRILVLISYN